MPPRSHRFARVLVRTFEDVDEHGLILLKYHHRHCKVTLDLIDFGAELLGHVSHISPEAALRKELNQGQVAELQQSGEGDAVSLHVRSGFAHCWGRDFPTSHKKRTSDPL